MQKPALSLIILILAIIGMNGCNKQEPGRYYSKGEKFSIKFPSNWEIKEKFMDTSVIAIAPLEKEDTQFRRNVNIFVEELATPKDPEKHFNETKDYISSILNSFGAKHQTSSSVNNCKAYTLIYTHKVDKFGLQVFMCQLIGNNFAYTITCSDIQEQFAQHKQEFQNIVNSFKVE